MLNKTLKIIRATIEELPEIEGLNKKYFHEVRDFKKIISCKESYFYVARIKNEVVGFAGFRFYKWNNTAQVIDIFIHPNHRGKGYGSLLAEKILVNAEKLNVRTIIAEAPSLSKVFPLYIKLGFRICGYNDRYYSNDGNEVAIFLSRDVK